MLIATMMRHGNGMSVYANRLELKTEEKRELITDLCHLMVNIVLIVSCLNFNPLQTCLFDISRQATSNIDT